MSTTATPVIGALPTTENIYAAASLGTSANVGIYLDLTASAADWEDRITIRDSTGSSASSTSGVSINFYPVVLATTTSTTITGGSTTSITIASGTGFARGMKIGLGNSSGVGEVVTTSTSYTAGSTTLTLAVAPANSYSGTTNVYVLCQTPPFGVPTLGQNTATGNATYSTYVYAPVDTYFISLTNTDATYSVTVSITGRLWTGVISQ